MRAWLAAPLIGFLLTACPSDDGNGDDETTPVDGTPVANALCEYHVRCETQIGRLAGSVQECVDLLIAMTNNCEPFVLDNTQAEVDACVAWLGAEMCEWNVFEARSPYQTGPCGALHGFVEEPLPKAGPGEDCSDADACVDGYFCDRAVAAGTCIICVARGGAGDPCNTDLQCQDTLFCDTAASECTAPRADGGACSTDRQCSASYCIDGTCGQPLERGDDCSAGSRCRGNLTCIDGSCTDRLGQGETCTPTDCRLGFVCDQNTCQQTAQCGSGVVGDRCSDSNACGAGLYCNDSGEVCAAQLGSDATCFGSEGECGPTNICRSSDHTCQPPGESGAECSASSDCLDGLYCDYNQSQCATLEPNGNECDWDGMCASGYCDQSVIPQVCADEPACTMP